MNESQHCHHDSGEFVGSAVVVGATFDREHSILSLRTFTDCLIDFVIQGVPDPDGYATLMTTPRRPISVKIHGGAREYTVVTLGAGGAQSAEVAQGTALALIQSGVHAVVDGGLPSSLSCSTRSGLEPAP